MEGLRRGDLVLIAEVTGLSYEMVKKVLKGERSNTRITRAAQKLIRSRQSFLNTTKRVTKIATVDVSAQQE